MSVAEHRTAAELRAATDQLGAAGIASPRVDAELLLAHLLHRSRGQLLLVDRLSPAQAGEFAELIRRRAARIPLQHLTGSAPFRRLELAVGPGVFIPRPETEFILELAADRLTGAATVLDLGAGSGAIALSVAHEHPNCRVIAVERSPKALSWLRRNADARMAAGDSPIEIIEADLAEPDLLAELTGTVDVVLANPPYVPGRIRSELAAEIGHDPDEAVYAGMDGLALMPAVLGAAARLLRRDGFVVIEHDDSQDESLVRLLGSSRQWQLITGHRDLAGRTRFSSAARA